MPRTARFMEPELPYHVTQRGNFRMNVFDEEEDFEKYLELLNWYSRKYQLEVWAYCLMHNHIHLIAYPRKKESLARTLATTHMVYSQYFNKKKEQNGHLWQGRFFSCALDQDHLIRAARYVELNPVRAGLVELPEEWEWSSAACHLGFSTDQLLDSNTWPDEALKNDWEEILKIEDSQDFVNQLELNTNTGRPLGHKTWIESLEKKTGQLLHALPRGRQTSKKQ